MLVISQGIKEFQIRLSSVSEAGSSELLQQTTVTFDNTVRTCTCVMYMYMCSVCVIMIVILIYMYM